MNVHDVDPAVLSALRAVMATPQFLQLVEQHRQALKPLEETAILAVAMMALEVELPPPPPPAIHLTLFKP